MITIDPGWCVTLSQKMFCKNRQFFDVRLKFYPLLIAKQERLHDVRFLLKCNVINLKDTNIRYYKDITKTTMEEDPAKGEVPTTTTAQTTARFRRNIITLNDNQRKQYFWCLKMLGILPPFPLLKNRTLIPYNPFARVSRVVQPTCLHDELIANHSTCCLHRDFFFAHYHRHLMVHFELRLNYADEVLRLTPEEFKNKFSKYYTNRQKQWERVLEEYKKIAPKDRIKVMAHYWNPTNYNCRDDLVLPDELADPLYYPHELDQMDQLFKSVCGVYPYQMNPQTRWSENKQQFNGQITEIPSNEYSQKQRKMINGQLGPRNHGNLSQFIKDYNAYLGKNQNQVIQRIIDSHNKTSKCNLTSMLEGETLLNYGGRFNSAKRPYNYQYFNLSEIQNGDSFNKVAYNQLLPHYQLAYALLNKKHNSLAHFLQFPYGINIETSHNFMHDNLRFLLSHPQYSVTNLLFYPYHSWIDLELEMKLRLCHNACQANQLKQFMIDKGHANRYIPQWTNPQNSRQSIRLVRGLDYLLAGENNQQVRTSLNLNDYYRNYYFTQQNNKGIYNNFEGFKDYDFNFDYQVFEVIYNEDTKQFIKVERELGDGEKTFIPKYLQDMRQQVNLYDDLMVKQIKKTIERLNQYKLKDYPLKFYRKLLDKRFFLLLTYKSTIKNGTYTFSANLQGLLDFLKKKGYEISKKQIEAFKKVGSGIDLFALCQFGREEDAVQCPNCQPQSYHAVNINQQIDARIIGQDQSSFKSLWNNFNSILLKDLNKNILKQQELDDTVDLKGFLNIKQKQQKQQELFKIQYIEGAEELSIDFNLTSNVKIYGFQIKLDLDSRQILKHEDQLKFEKQTNIDDLPLLPAVQQRKNVKISYEFMNPPSSDNSKSNSSLKKRVYYQVTASIYVNKVRQEFTFKIRHYHENIRYVIDATFHNGSLSVQVFDKDQKFKEEYYK